MNSLEFIRVALESIRAHKLRSFLTTLGIVIGIASVITVMAVGQGGRTMLMKEMEKFGSNLFVVYVNYEDSIGWSPWDITDADIRMLKQGVPEIKYIAPVNYNSLRVRGSRDEKSFRIIATSEDYADIHNLQLSRGRFFTDREEKSGRRVVVMDYQAAEQVFKNEEAVGKTVLVEGNPALVIGVLKKEESALGFDSSPKLYLPRTMLGEITGNDYINEIECSTYSKEQVAIALDRAKRLMERRHNAPGHYTGYNMEKEMQSANKITGIMTLIIGAIAAISLVVGGIGVMNIMLVSVSERTREIGIRMALGAKRRDILVQFLIEAIVLCFIGGIIGIALGYGGAFIIAKIAKWPPLVSGSTILLACGFSALVGIIFGLLPANQASRLDPIEALRRD